MKNQPRQLTHVRAAIESHPWAITREWLEAICDIVETHVSGEKPAEFVPRVKRGRRCPECREGVLRAIMSAGAWGPVPSGKYECPDCDTIVKEADLPPYEVVRRMAILPLDGPLFPKANLMTRYSGATSYEEFTQLFSHAMMSEEVDSALIISDSPGGSCLGMAETCSLIHAARQAGQKMVIGLISPMAASAAYGIISQCEHTFITESAMAGSIGTILSYSNWERAERNEGNDRVTLMSSELKSVGVPQTMAQFQSLQETLDAYYGQFKTIVQRGRPSLKMDAVAGGKVWIGEQAVKMGLADGVSTLEKVISDFGT